ncbi:S1C family serine protease [Ornithinibacillus californiensis]|uniref:S1C family serine protease n=1 Tax=Ornithinibacillus californiensis TaxID=161536 RepID=UPI00064E0E4A|nr:trypsin-like peptidase domain-containing protein [Ornithinibacillus californiensis]
MGYYNQNYPPNPNRKKGNSWLSILLGVVIGVALMAVFFPRIQEMSTQTNNQSEKSTSHNAEQQIVSLDVSTRITEVVNVVSPTVVGITNIEHKADFWEQQQESEAGTGSGVIYKKDAQYAYVVTNHHVIEGADEIEVLLNDDTVIEATLLGKDLFSDLAVLRIDGDAIDRTIELGTTENLKVGEPVIAIGNPLGHMFSGSVTQGIISGTQRTIPQDFNLDGRADWQAEVIQTDAAINPGNSGGALINMDAQLIGINSMKINQEAVEGIGFSIPIDTAWPIIDELEKTGTVRRPYIGVEIYSLEEIPRLEWEETLSLPKDVEGGVYVWSVEPRSPADLAGLERLDVITHLDGKQIMNMIDLRKILYQEKDIGDEISMTYYRDGKKVNTTLVLDEQR